MAKVQEAVFLACLSLFMEIMGSQDPGQIQPAVPMKHAVNIQTH